MDREIASYWLGIDFEPGPKAIGDLLVERRREVWRRGRTAVLIEQVHIKPLA